jgi:hypothetical protein
MQRTEVVALVAGATVGIGGGVLGGFLACTAGLVAMQRILDEYQYLDLGPPAPPGARTTTEPIQDLPEATAAARVR